MLTALFKRLKRKMMYSDARLNVLECRRMTAQPQLMFATELTNSLRIRMLQPKVELLVMNAFKDHWNTQLANQYLLSVQCASILELANELSRLTVLMNADYALTKDDIHTTTKDVLLGIYLTHHSGIFIDPNQSLIAFLKASVAFSKALQFYLDRNPDTAQYILRITSSYTISINAILDDLTELQCDFLSP